MDGVLIAAKLFESYYSRAVEDKKLDESSASLRTNFSPRRRRMRGAGGAGEGGLLSARIISAINVS